MLKKRKKQISKLIMDIIKLLNILKNNSVHVNVVVKDCIDALNGVSLELDSKKDKIAMGKLKEIIAMIDDINTYIHRKNRSEKINCIISKLKSLDNEIKNINKILKIVFMPYKHSMWDCMESVYNVAKNDENFDCKIIPIPYYDRTSSMELGEMHYEGDMYEQEIVDYKNYNLEEDKPDVIVIHNPYDGGNRVTSIDNRFYSDNLKNNTDLLVYIPYYIFGYTVDLRRNWSMARTPGEVNADMVVLPSQILKDIYVKGGSNPDKLEVLGSPKIDKIINNCEYKVPNNWIELKGNRKVILMSISIASYLNIPNWLERTIEWIQHIKSREDVMLVWRPHPLLEATVMSMRLDDKPIYDKLMTEIDLADNIVKDDFNDAFHSIAFSDALISDYSTLALQYIFTGKPLLSLTESKEMEDRIILCDYFGSYFVNDGISVKNFIDMVVNEDDPWKEERVRRAKASIVNTDGTCGEKVLKKIKEKFI